jgi:hypothetical protein
MGRGLEWNKIQFIMIFEHVYSPLVRASDPFFIRLRLSHEGPGQARVHPIAKDLYMRLQCPMNYLTGWPSTWKGRERVVEGLLTSKSKK